MEPGTSGSGSGRVSEGMVIFRALPDRLRLAHTVRHVSDILSDAGFLEQAVPHYEE